MKSTNKDLLLFAFKTQSMGIEIVRFAFFESIEKVRDILDSKSMKIKLINALFRDIAGISPEDVIPCSAQSYFSSAPVIDYDMNTIKI